MTSHERQIGESMYNALKNLPCRCSYNVPYAGCKVKQVVTAQCARCRSMAAWEALVLEAAA